MATWVQCDLILFMDEVKQKEQIEIDKKVFQEGLKR
jgi:hypothetical protein